MLRAAGLPVGDIGGGRRDVPLMPRAPFGYLPRMCRTDATTAPDTAHLLARMHGHLATPEPSGRRLTMTKQGYGND
jgi:hypothetical protein